MQLHSRSLQTFADFLPKMAEHGVTKTPFSKNDGFFATLVGDVRLMPDKVMKVLRRYLLPFLSYRENTEGGGVIFPTPALRGLNMPI